MAHLAPAPMAGAFRCRLRQVIAARHHTKYVMLDFSIPVGNLAYETGKLLLCPSVDTR